MIGKSDWRKARLEVGRPGMGLLQISTGKMRVTWFRATGMAGLAKGMDFGDMYSHPSVSVRAWFQELPEYQNLQMLKSLT